MPSVDVVSEVDMQEVDNAVNAAVKEIENRYDFRGTNTEMELNKKEKKIRLLVLLDEQEKVIKRIVARACGNAGHDNVFLLIKRLSSIIAGSWKHACLVTRTCRSRASASAPGPQAGADGRLLGALKTTRSRSLPSMPRLTAA